MQIPRKKREPGAGSLDTEPKMTLSKPFRVVPRSLSGCPTREKGRRGNFLLPRTAVSYKGEQTARTASLRRQLRTHPASLPPRSARLAQPGAAPRGLEQSGWGKEEGERPAGTLLP